MIRSVSLDLFLLRRYAAGVEHVKAALTAAGVLAARRAFCAITNAQSGSVKWMLY